MKKNFYFMLLTTFFYIGSFAPTVFAKDLSSLSSKDKDFVIEAINGGMMEVEMGGMAQNKAQNLEVKNFGTRMVMDHGQANKDLKTIAQQKGISLPSEMWTELKAKVNELTKFSGDDFDKKYMNEMVADHTMDVEKFKKALKETQDPDIRNWIIKTLPIIENHLQEAKDLVLKINAQR
ncbi:MAG: DUF4142 domain-containing protein [Oligoflexia bacterium]|nr:DUF4142 domain-containing protein [Oligoflexia bacterium]